MSAADIIAKLDAQRTRWLDLPGDDGDGEGGKKRRLQVMRPLETDADRMAGRRLLGDLAEALCEFVVGWEGFSEADILGPKHGSAEPLPFDRALCLRIVRDRTDYVVALGVELKTAMQARLAEKAEAAKNS